MDAQTTTIVPSKPAASVLLNKRQHGLLNASCFNHDAMVTLGGSTKRLKLKRVVTLPSTQRQHHSIFSASCSNHSATISLCYPQTKRYKLERAVTTQHGNDMINALPNHIVSDILFECLDHTPKQLSTLRNVCKLFRSMANSSLQVLDFKGKVHLNIPKALFSQLSNLREVDFSHCTNFTDKHLEQLAPMRQKLRVLKLRGTNISDDGIMSFLEYDKCLKAAGENLKQSNAFPSLPLEVLDLSKTKSCGRSRITNQSLLAIAYTCLDLKHLFLSMCSGITDDFLDSLPLFLTKLTTLDVSMTSITALGCCHLARLPSLREVDISACPVLSGQAINALVSGKHPCASEVIGMNDEKRIMQNLGLIRENGSASRLTSITARFANDIDAHLLDTLDTRAPHLQTLDLQYYCGHDLKTGFLSPLKMSLRNLRRNGVDVKFSRA